VIPIKIEQKRRVQGVVHGASSSGQTVFVEPLETIEQNNELVRLLDEEQAEIHRILLEMTRRIGESSELIRRAADVLGELELQFAKARFAEDYRCVPVLVGENSRLILINARHPILERNLKSRGGQVVPVSLELEDQRVETGHHRPKHWRKNSHPENGGTAVSDGAVGHSSPGGPRRVAGV